MTTDASRSTVLGRRAAYTLLAAFELALLSTIYGYFLEAHDAEQPPSCGGVLALGLAVGALNALYVCLFFDLVFPADGADVGGRAGAGDEEAEVEVEAEVKGEEFVDGEECEG